MHLALLEPYDPNPTPCVSCGHLISPPPVRDELTLTSDETVRMGEYRRRLDMINWTPLFTAKTLSQPDRYEQLCRAIASGETWQVKWELVDGADPNQTKELKPFPLHVAAERGNVDIVRLLLSVGADPGNIHDGVTAQAFAEKASQSEVAVCLKNAVAFRMQVLSVLYPINYLLSGYFLPLPFALFAAGSCHLPLMLGVLLIGHLLLWFLLRSQTFYERCNGIGIALTLAGGLIAVGTLSLVLLALGTRAVSVNSQHSTGLGGLLAMALVSTIIAGLGYLQFKMTLGKRSSLPVRIQKPYQHWTS